MKEPTVFRPAALASLAAVAALAVVVHLPALDNGFALDDVWHVQQNELVQRGLERPGELLASPYLPYTDSRRSPYRPLTSLSYAVDWARGGGAPAPFHVTNVVLHAAAAMGLAALLFTLGAGIGPTLAGAGLFAVHPLHVEAVAGIVGRADVLATLAVLLGCLVYLWRGPTWLRMLGVSAAYALALGAKETGVTLPALLVVMEALRRPEAHRAGTHLGGRTPSVGRRLWSERWHFVALLGVLGLYLATRARVLGTLGTYDVAPYIAVLPAGERVATAVANLPEVARLLLLPVELSSEYGPAVILPTGLGSLRFWAGTGMVVGFGVLAVLAWHRGARLVAGGIAWTALAFAPLSNVVVPLPMWIAERTLYLPSVGFALALCGGVPLLMRWRPVRSRRTAPAGAAVLVGLLVAAWSWRSWERSSVWRTTASVMSTLAEEHPESFRARWWVADRLLEAGEQPRALQLYRQALELNPNDAFLHLEFARALLVAGRPEEAEEQVRGLPEGITPAWYVYLGRSLLAQGRTEEADDVVRRGLETHPREPRLLELAKESEGGR